MGQHRFKTGAPFWNSKTVQHRFKTGQIPKWGTTNILIERLINRSMNLQSRPSPTI